MLNNLRFTKMMSQFSAKIDHRADNGYAPPYRKDVKSPPYTRQE